MKVEIYKCPHCKEEIYSRANHDYKYCKCESLAVDGGHEDDDVWKAFRIIGEIEAETRIVEIEITEENLYKDWNYDKNDYGVYNG